VCSVSFICRWLLLQSQLEALRSDIGRLSEEKSCILADMSLLQKMCAGCKHCATRTADCRLSVVRLGTFCHTVRRGGLGTLATWHLPDGPIGMPASWAAMSNVEGGSGMEEGAQGP